MNLFAQLVEAPKPDALPKPHPLDRQIDEAVLDVALVLEKSAEASRRLQDELQVLEKLMADYQRLMARRAARITPTD